MTQLAKFNMCCSEFDENSTIGWCGHFFFYVKIYDDIDYSMIYGNGGNTSC
jgi:hypothetical protein